MQPIQSAYIDVDRAEVHPFVPHWATSFLDVGCSRGGFGELLRRERGDAVRIVGVEPTAASAAQARSRGFDEVLEGFFPDAFEGRDDTFDVITFNDVLEHTVDPWDILRRTRERLTERGVVVAAIPNIGNLRIILDLARGRFDYAETGILDRTHLRFFTRRTMIGLFEDSGYAVVSVDGIHAGWDGRMRRVNPLVPLLGSAAYTQFVVVARPAS